MKVLWFIPTHGDGRYLGTSIGGRRVNHAYFAQIARAVDDLGFYGALLPTGRSCEDAWMVASSLIPLTRRMRFLVAIRPGLMSPGLSARMTSSFDRLSGGRILINVVTGGDPEELAGDGLHLSHDERYEVTDEFLSVWRGMLSGETVQHSGKHLDIRDGRIYFEGVQKPYPPLWFGGSSPAAIDVAAKHIDTYLTWGEPPEQVGEKIEQVRRRAAEFGRSLRFGIRLHVIVRETAREAWQDAERLIQFVDDATIEKARALLAKHDSVGQQRMLALHGGDRSKLEVSPNLWAGVGLVRGGAGTALVGDAETVAERMREYASLGIDTFILSGYPHLEEAYRVAELLFPQLPLDHGDSPDQNAEAIRADGEMMANRQFPSEAKPVSG